jgi:ABC-type glycerol-3-phosphate transport system substrate-binding protein
MNATRIGLLALLTLALAACGQSGDQTQAEAAAVEVDVMEVETPDVGEAPPDVMAIEQQIEEEDEEE